jgi:hypothetical protein
MATVSNLNQYLTEGAIQGFTSLIMPVTSFGYVVKPGLCALNDTVRVPFAQNTSASYDFAYGTGYASDGNTVTGKTITMGSIKYQKITLTDSDLVLLNQQALTNIGFQAGQALASDVISASLASVVTQANFPNSGSNSSVSNFTSSLNAVAALVKTVSDYKWPVGQRSLICGTQLYANLLANSGITVAQNFGSTGPVQQGMLSTVLGFTPYLTSLTLPNSDAGFAVNPNAILFGNAYHAPQDFGSQYSAVNQLTDDKTGLTIGFRQYYDPSKATNVRVFDCLFGAGVGDSTALYHIK